LKPSGGCSCGFTVALHEISDTKEGKLQKGEFSFGYFSLAQRKVATYRGKDFKIFLQTLIITV
jgi:hypothetical protein